MLFVGFVSRLVSHIKGERFVLAKDISTLYLIRFIFSKICALIYGSLRLCHVCYIHPTTTIKSCSKLHIGKNFSVARGCYIDALSKRGLICGDNVSLGYHTHIELTGSLKLLGQGMIVGNNVGLGSHGHYGSGAGLLTIGDDTIFGNYVSIHPENHNYSDISTPIRLQGVNSSGGVRIGTNCWIGAKVTILDGTVLEDGCIVAAGAVVKGHFPKNSIIGGVPARIIKKRV